MEAGDAALGGFANWLNPCGTTAALPDDLRKVFDILNGIGVLPKGPKIPKGLPKAGGGKPSDRGNPSLPTKIDPPKTNPPTTSPPDTASTTAPNTASTTACNRRKRENDGKSPL